MSVLSNHLRSVGNGVLTAQDVSRQLFGQRASAVRKTATTTRILLTQVCGRRQEVLTPNHPADQNRNCHLSLLFARSVEHTCQGPDLGLVLANQHVLGSGESPRDAHLQQHLIHQHTCAATSDNTRGSGKDTRIGLQLSRQIAAYIAFASTSFMDVIREHAHQVLGQYHLHSTKGFRVQWQDVAAWPV